MAYRIELTLKEQYKELKDMLDTVESARMNLSRKHSMLPSERAMTSAKYDRAATALLMAIDRLTTLIAENVSAE
jgi:hypothetical protein